jgi:hypothetical protein
VAVDRLLALPTVIQMLLLVVLSEELVPATYLRLLGPSSPGVDLSASAVPLELD